MKKTKLEPAAWAEEATITSAEAFEREVEAADDVLLGERSGISEDLAQLLSYAEKIYDLAVPLRSDTLSRDLREERLTRVREGELRLEDRISDYMKWVTSGNALRERDYADLAQTELLQEKIRAILTLETGVGELPEMKRVRERQETQREELKRQSKKGSSAAASMSIVEQTAKDSEIAAMVIDIKRSEHRRQLEVERESAAQRQWERTKAFLKLGLLVGLLLGIPAAYFVFSYVDKNKPVAVDIRPYREIFQMQRAFTKGTEFRVEVAASWKDLYEREKRIQMKELTQRVSNQYRRIKVMDPAGTIVAELRHGDIILY